MSGFLWIQYQELKYSTRNSPIGFDSFIVTAWGFFCNSGIISPRQQTTAQKPFSRQALDQSGVMFFNILKIMRHVDDPRRNQTSFLTVRLFFNQYLSSRPTISHRIQYTKKNGNHSRYYLLQEKKSLQQYVLLCTPRHRRTGNFLPGGR